MCEEPRIAREIAGLIRGNKEFILTNSGASSEAPIPWILRKISDYERKEEYFPEAGLRVVINEDEDFGAYTTLNMATAEKAVQEMLEKYLQQASKKFQDFNDHIRIFVTEAYSNNPLVDNELIGKIVKKINVLGNIDEIWVGFPRWVSENDYVRDFRRIK